VTPKPGAAIRLQRYLAQSGVAARRKAEQLIVGGAVRVNGKVVTQLGTKVDPHRDHVTVRGQAVVPEELFYCVLNKPKGCVTAVSDPRGRRTVMEYLPGLPAHVVPVGRLDFYTEGVLLLTNDGELAAALLSPASHVEKTYHVKLKGGVTDEQIERLRDGVRIDRHTVTRPAQVDRLSHASSHGWLIITITEGKSRQIHRMAEALGLEVLKLQRVAFAGITFHGLRVGDARELTQAEVSQLRALAALPHSAQAVSRGKWSARRERTELSRRARTRDREGPESTDKPTAKQSRRPKPASRAKGVRSRRGR
jgi:23S rRNA pseudouridine2605 synthase